MAPEETVDRKCGNGRQKNNASRLWEALYTKSILFYCNTDVAIIRLALVTLHIEYIITYPVTEKEKEDILSIPSFSVME